MKKFNDIREENEKKENALKEENKTEWLQDLNWLGNEVSFNFLRLYVLEYLKEELLRVSLGRPNDLDWLE